MQMTERKFLKVALVAAAVLALPALLLIWNAGPAHAQYNSPNIPLFRTTLRGIDVIPVAAPDPTGAPVTGVTHYTIQIKQFTDQIVPTSTGLGPTTLWGYHPANPLQGATFPQAHLGGIIVGEKGKPIQITFKNMLPTTNNIWGQIHPLPVDTTIPEATKSQNRVATHLHGGDVPWISDGGPFDWFDPGTSHGDSFLNNQVLNPGAGPGEAEYYYPLNQSARFLWYHDHAVGITRLNAQIGIASGMLVRDNFERALRLLGLPDFIENGGRELPIVIQDKIFVGVDIGTADPDWPGASTSGSLWYAHAYTDEPEGGKPPQVSAVPEYFGDTMLVNGASYPEVEVQARRYRLRLLNATNARFLNLQLFVADIDATGNPLNTNGNGIALDANGNPLNLPFVNAATGKPTWLQIGTEGGFLRTPANVPSNVPYLITDPAFLAGGPSLNPSLVNKSLVVAPAERPDVIVDFRGYEGKSIILYNDAPAPFPSGGPDTDYFPGLNTADNPVNKLTPNGSGPNTRVLMRFKVVPAQPPLDKKLLIGENTPLILGIDPPLLPWVVNQVPAFFQRRFLTLNEYHDEFGRLIQTIGNDLAPFGSPYFGTATYPDYSENGKPKTVGATEEHVRKGKVEVWEIYNTTGDVHPMHFHLVNVQLINRQLFSGDASNPVPFGPIIKPEQNEIGWKETVPLYPGTVTRVIMKFDMPDIVKADGKVIKTPPSPRTGGFEYVWHCHILEHEEHDMMHALVVE